MTADQNKRVTEFWSAIAKEPVKVEETTGTLYAFGSELACYRLFYKLKCGRVNYSTNLSTWYYVMDDTQRIKDA